MGLLASREFNPGLSIVIPHHHGMLAEVGCVTIVNFATLQSIWYFSIVLVIPKIHHTNCVGNCRPYCYSNSAWPSPSVDPFHREHGFHIMGKRGFCGESKSRLVVGPSITSFSLFSRLCNHYSRIAIKYAHLDWRISNHVLKAFPILFFTSNMYATILFQPLFQRFIEFPTLLIQLFFSNARITACDFECPPCANLRSYVGTVWPFAFCIFRSHPQLFNV